MGDKKMTHLDLNRNDITPSDIRQIASTGNNGGAGRECGRGEYELQSSTKARLVLQLAEGSERKED
jgi:hypothetical protein